MARTKQTARRSTGGKTPRRHVTAATKAKAGVIKKTAAATKAARAGVIKKAPPKSAAPPRTTKLSAAKLQQKAAGYMLAAANAQSRR